MGRGRRGRGGDGARLLRRRSASGGVIMSTGADKLAAAQTARNEVNRLRNLLAIADDLEKLGKIENSEASLRATISALEVKQRDATAAVEAAVARAAEIMRKANADAEAVRADAQAVKDSATKDAEKAVEAAEQRARTIVATAESKKLEIENEIRGRVSA